MGDQEDYSKLPLEEQVVHKVWKVRVAAYEQLVKKFEQQDDEKSPFYDTYTGLIKKFVTDTNANAQVNGVKAALAFVENAAVAKKVASSVVSGIVAKCVGSSKAATKSGATDVCLMFVEIECGEPVIEELMNGFDNRVPKVVAGSVAVVTEIVNQFGIKAFPVKPLLKKLPKVFKAADGKVRDAAKELAIALYKWIGAAMKNSLSDLKPVQVQELEAVFADISGKPKPTRYRRSDKPKDDPVAKTVDDDGNASEGQGSDDEEGEPDMDPYDLADPVAALSKVPKTFNEDIVAAKWSTRKEALQGLLAVIDVPKLESEDWNDITKMLKNVVAKDSNVLNVAFAAKCIGALAAGLRKNFSANAHQVITTMLEKFKEKKTNVVTALHGGLDSITYCLPIEKIAEEGTAVLSNKNPEVKANTMQFLARAIIKAGNLPKAAVKPLGAATKELMMGSVPNVRDAATTLLATISHVCGERSVKAHVADLDAVKTKKFEAELEKVKAGQSGGTAASKSSAKEKAPAATSTAKASKPRPKPGATKAASKRPSSSRPTKSAASSSSSSSSAKPASKSSKPKASKAISAKIEDPSEPELSGEAATAITDEFIPEAMRKQFKEAAWKERLDAAEKLQEKIKGGDTITGDQAQALFMFIETVAKKWKETNFQINRMLISTLAEIARKCAPLPERCAHMVIPHLVPKIGDMKVREAVSGTLTAFCEALSVNFVSLRICELGKKQKNPKTLAEIMNWMSATLIDFGMKIATKPHVDLCKSCLASVNPAVRSACINFLGNLRMFVGPNLIKLFEDEKPALVAVISDKFSQMEGKSPDAPVKFEYSAKASEEEDAAVDDEGEETAPSKKKKTRKQSEEAVDDLFPKVDITTLIPANVITEMSDKNWKVRGEALDNITEVLKKNPRIETNLGDLGSALAQTLRDTNKNHCMSTMNILAMAATGMRSGCKKHLGVYLGGILANLGDAKDTVRASGVACLSAWYEQLDLASFLEQDSIPVAIAKGKPNEQKELLLWLAEKMDAEESLPSLKTLVKPMFAALEHRNADVRKAAIAVLPSLIRGVGYDKMKSACSSLTGSSSTKMLELIDKHKGEDAPKPKKKASKAATKESTESKAPRKESATATTKRTGTLKKRPGTAKTGSKSTSKSSSKGDDSDSLSAPFLDSKGKEKRMADEKNLKVLKWNFTTPRSEFTAQLEDQMSGNVSKGLIALLFSDDFRKHSKALDVMTAAVATQTEEMMGNLDVLLKWITLRFFETNTTVLLKSIKFLQELFEAAVAHEYELSEYEASSFLPYLLLKSGDKIENVRKDVHTIFHLLTKIYPASKLFAYLLEGLKSKNAKQRTECLVELGTLIKLHGMGVCQIGAAKAMKTVSAQISDRDNSVRSAALDYVVECYDIIGEDVYKLLGNIGDKNTSLVQERIKRHSKKKPDEKSADPAPNTKSNKLRRQKSKKDKTVPTKEASNIPKVKQEFSLDLDSLGFSDPLLSEMPELAPTELDDVMSLTSEEGKENNAPAASTVSAASMVSASVSAIPVPSSSSLSSEALKPKTFLDRPITAPANVSESSDLEDVITKIGSSSLGTSINALKSLEDLAKSKSPRIVPAIDTILSACCLQMELVFTSHLASDKALSDPKELAEVVRLCKHLLSCVLLLFTGTDYSNQVALPRLNQLVVELVTRLLDPKLESLQEGPQISRALNMILLKILENGKRSDVFEVLINSLRDGLSGVMVVPQRFNELVMKCVWKLTKTIPDCMDKIDASQLLLVVHHFLEKHPPAAWKQVSDDTPLRTMKTILHSLVKASGIEILKHLSYVASDPTGTAVGAYLVLMLEKTGHPSEFLKSYIAENHKYVEKRQEPVKAPAQTPSQSFRRTDSLMEFASMESGMTKSLDNINEDPASNTAATAENYEGPAISEILKLIMSKATTKDGIEKLHTYKEAHPSENIEEHIAGLSPYMKSYVQRQLAERSSTSTSSIPRPKTTGSLRPAAPSATTASAYLQRLRSLTAKSTTSEPEGVKTPEPKPVADLPEVVARVPLTQVPGDNTPAAPVATESAISKLSDIKSRLARMKKQQSHA